MKHSAVFKLAAKFQPAGDQPKAIAKLSQGLKKGLKHQVLLGVTGSGKTFTVANIISQVQRPTLIIAHNKTLAAQLATEYRQFFPNNAVEYFVSYYDYYQPEAYLPNTDTYIEKEAQINNEIDRLRHSATSAVLKRRDVIVVASVSAIYGLGSPQEYEQASITLSLNDSISREKIIDQLVFLQYQRNDFELNRGRFRVRGFILEIVPADSDNIIRAVFDSNRIERLTILKPTTMEIVRDLRSVTIFPASHFVMPVDRMEAALKNIEAELENQLRRLTSANKLLEAERLKRRTRYDLEMIREVGYCTGIENYSRHFDFRRPGEPPTTLINYFPKDYLLIIDESHVTIPQIGGMYAGDRSRKDTLIEFGFRLPSARDNRPLKFNEFEAVINQVIYTSATPGPYELEKAQPPHGQVVEQIIRPTGLVDPILRILPSSNQVKDLYPRLEAVINRGERALITTLTKKMAEDLTDHLIEKGYKVRYLHSEIETLERIEILRDLRQGTFDILIGVNLLREGLDLPEVSLVAILDADKEGFLRSERSLIQTIGRAARHVSGEVLLYADKLTDSLNKAINITNEQRQLAYNQQHHITPQSISKEVTSLIEQELRLEKGFDSVEEQLARFDRQTLIKQKERQMKLAAQELQFELAAILRDEIVKLKKIETKLN